jgi:hypothetical protein
VLEKGWGGEGLREEDAVVDDEGGTAGGMSKYTIGRDGEREGAAGLVRKGSCRRAGGR